jgi:hypothetical protein
MLRRIQLAIHQTLEEVDRKQPNRRFSFRIGSPPREQYFDHYFVEAVTVVEGYVDRLARHSFLHNPSVRLPEKTTWQKEFLKSTMNWRNRESAFEVYHGVELKLCDKFNEYKAATTARNSLVHGMGYLTASQESMDDIVETISVLEIEIASGQLEFSPTTFERLFLYCEDFVIDLDKRLFAVWQSKAPLSSDHCQKDV